jgi:hypothetical protein
VDAIAALARRFPDHARSIRRLEAEDATFRAIYEDYGLALRALAYWRVADQSAQPRAEEYRRLVMELEAEALAILQTFEAGKQGRR